MLPTMDKKNSGATEPEQRHGQNELRIVARPPRYSGRDHLSSPLLCQIPAHSVACMFVTPRLVQYLLVHQPKTMLLFVMTTLPSTGQGRS